MRHSLPHITRCAYVLHSWALGPWAAHQVLHSLHGQSSPEAKVRPCLHLHASTAVSCIQRETWTGRQDAHLHASDAALCMRKQD